MDRAQRAKDATHLAETARHHGAPSNTTQASLIKKTPCESKGFFISVIMMILPLIWLLKEDRRYGPHAAGYPYAH